MSLLFPIIKRTMKQPKRKFLPCDGWVFFKIYCGEISLDRLLINELRNYIEKLNTKNLIKSWFFIRYYDPDHHVRLRLEIQKKELSYEIIKSLNNAIKELVTDNFIWKIEISSYDREIERYTWLNYNISEQLFHIDSSYYLKSLEYLTNNELKFLYNIKASLDFIQIFYPKGNDLLHFIKISEGKYKQEFEITKITQNQLSTKYRSMKAAIIAFFGEAGDGNFKMLREILSLKNFEIKKLLNQSNFPENVSERFSFVSGHIHMNTNRTFATNQRLYEMITYDHLYRYYNSLLQQNSK